MSNKILNLVRNARIGDPVAKEVLKVIADQSNDAGSGVWSSFNYIAWCIERSRSTVIKKCNELRADEILESDLRPGTSNLWRINIDALVVLGETYREKIENWSELETEGSKLETGGVQTGDPSPSKALSNQEPTYIDDVGGVPDELEMEWDNFLGGWKRCFPDKIQPRRTNAPLKTKFKTRMNNAQWRATWRSALWLAKDWDWAQEEGWFRADWILKNNDNIAKLLTGTFDFKLEEQRKNAPVKRPKFVDARPKEDA